jgi:hypothetical protein
LDDWVLTPLLPVPFRPPFSGSRWISWQKALKV